MIYIITMAVVGLGYAAFMFCVNANGDEYGQYFDERK
jgi:hypothetical protein